VVGMAADEVEIFTLSQRHAEKPLPMRFHFCP
jgi:hypothetical protein